MKFKKKSSNPSFGVRAGKGGTGRMFGSAVCSVILFCLGLWLFLALLLGLLPVVYLLTAMVLGIPADPSIREVLVWFCLCLLETGWGFVGSLLVIRGLFRKCFTHHKEEISCQD